MTQFPKDEFDPAAPSPSGEDQALVTFLRCYAPPTPETAVDLEHRILNAVTTVAAPTTLRPTPASSRRRSWWHRRQLLWLPTAIAAGMLLAWGSDRWFTPAQPSMAELEQLETFLQTSWAMSDEELAQKMAAGPETEALLLLEPVSEN